MAVGGAFKPGTGTGTGGTGTLTQQQTDEQYLTGRNYGGGALNPLYELSAGSVAASSPQELYSSDPTEMATVWNLPQGAGALRLPSGQSTSTPVDPKAQSRVQAGIQQLTLYSKLAHGDPLTSQDIAAATKIGGPVARAVQLIGKDKTVPGIAATPGKPGTRDSAIGEMDQNTQQVEALIGQTDPNALNTETPGTKGKKGTPAKTVKAKGTDAAVKAAKADLSDMMQTTLGINAGDLADTGEKIPKNLATVLQNVGYPVTNTMTLGQAVNATTGPNAQQPLPDMTGSQTVAQYLQGLSQMSKAQITGLQSALFNGGFYDDSYYEPGTTGKTAGLNSGNLDTGTILAMRKAILTTLDENAKGKQVTLEQVITGGTSAFPTIGSVSPTVNTPGVSANATLPMATSTQTQGPLISAFVSALGRNPTQQELAQFTSTYNQELLAGNKTYNAALSAQGETTPSNTGLSATGAVDYTTGIPFVQGTPTVGAAATNFAQTQDTTEYQGHNIANAFGMLMNLVDRQGVSSLNTPGTRPTTTS